MNHLEAQDELAESMRSAATKVKAYFWKLSGNDANSLCRFLGMEEEKLLVVLRLCKVYIGEKDNFSKNNFESLMSKCCCDWTTFKYKGRQERYIKIGVELMARLCFQRICMDLMALSHITLLKMNMSGTGERSPKKGACQSL
jgi:hypothetical protein